MRIQKMFVLLLWLHDKNEIYQVHGPFKTKSLAVIYSDKWFLKHGPTVKGHVVTYEVKRIIMTPSSVFHMEKL